MELNRLDKVFKQRKVQNRVLAKYFGKSESTISKWRNNKRQPSLTDLNEIARLLRMDVRDLLNESNWTYDNSPEYKNLKDT